MGFFERLAHGTDRAVRTLVYRGVLPVMYPKRPRVAFADVRRLLLIRCDAVGDMILSTGLIHALARRNPAMEIWAGVSDRNASVLEADTSVARTVQLVREGRIAPDGVRALRGTTFDVVMNLVINRATRYGVLARRIAPRAMTVGLAHPERPEYEGLFDVLVDIPDLYTRPFAEIMLEFGRQAFDLAIDDAEALPSITLDDTDHREADAFLRAHGASEAQPVLVNLSAGQLRKRWPAAKYERLLGALTARGVPCVLTAAPVDREMANALATATAVPVLVGNSIRAIAALTARCRLVVTPDTSVVHVAAAMRRPVIGLYADEGTVLGQWSPIGVPYRLVRTPGAAVEAIDVDDVLAAVDSLLSGAAPVPVA